MGIKRDLKSNVDLVQSLIPVTRGATGTGTAADILDYDSALVEISMGTMVAGGTLAGQLQESADGTTYGTVAAGDLLGTFTAWGTNAPGIERIGYIGTGRFIRPTLTFTGTGAGAPCAVTIIRSHPRRKPLS